MLSSAVNNAAPIIDQITGNSVLPNFSVNNSGRFSSRESHVPIKAPIKPTRIEIKQPLFVNPESDCPIEPVIPAMINKVINSKIPI